MTNCFDTIIIGGGPAGFTAGIYATRREMKTLILAKEIGGQLIWASEIENYPGFKSITNFELIDKMYNQTKDCGVEILSNEAMSIEKEGEMFKVTTEKEVFYGKTLILALGLSPRRLAIKGEVEFNGKGVSYCANCDGPLFRNKVVAVVGGGNSAVDAAELLSKIASKVYLIHRNTEFRAFESVVQEIKNRSNIEIMLESQISEIKGKDKVSEIIVNTNGVENTIQADGVFIEVGRIANTDIIEKLAARDEKNQIIVNDRCETNTPGVFACGDVTNIAFKQITIAAGQGTIAALSAYQYLQHQAGTNQSLLLDRGHKHV